MPTPQAVQAAYNEALPLVRNIESLVRPAVASWASDNSYFFRGRIKTAESLAEKLDGGRVDSWADIDDLYACTIVIPTARDLDRVILYLQSTFVERELRGRGVANKPPDVFRFDAPRFIGSVRGQEGIERMPGVEDLLFEVQILTAFEYAWQVATHDPVFKGSDIDWRRARLASHLKAAVEQADILIAAFDRSAEDIPASPFADTRRRKELVDYFVAAVESDEISSTLAPASWARFADNVLALVSSYSRRDALDDEVVRLVGAVREMVDRKEVPVSGSLFQLVVAAVVKLNGSKALKKHVIVESEELRSLYQITDVPRPMAF